MHNRMNESSLGIRTENMLQKEKSIRFVAIIIIILYIYNEIGNKNKIRRLRVDQISIC